MAKRLGAKTLRPTATAERPDRHRPACGSALMGPWPFAVRPSALIREICGQKAVGPLIFLPLIFLPVGRCRCRCRWPAILQSERPGTRRTDPATCLSLPTGKHTSAWPRRNAISTGVQHSPTLGRKSRKPRCWQRLSRRWLGSSPIIPEYLKRDTWPAFVWSSGKNQSSPFPCTKH